MVMLLISCIASVSAVGRYWPLHLLRFPRTRSRGPMVTLVAAFLVSLLLLISGCARQIEPETPPPSPSPPSERLPDQPQAATDWLAGLPLETEGFLTFDQLSLEQGLKGGSSTFTRSATCFVPARVSSSRDRLRSLPAYRIR